MIIKFYINHSLKGLSKNSIMAIRVGLLQINHHTEEPLAYPKSIFINLS